MIQRLHAERMTKVVPNRVIKGHEFKRQDNIQLDKKDKKLANGYEGQAKGTFKAIIPLKEEKD